MNHLKRTVKRSGETAQFADPGVADPVNIQRRAARCQQKVVSGSRHIIDRSSSVPVCGFRQLSLRGDAEPSDPVVGTGGKQFIAAQSKTSYHTGDGMPHQSRRNRVLV